MNDLKSGIAHQGNYLTLELTKNKDLKLTLTQEGREALVDNPENVFWSVLMEDVLCNSEFERVFPEEIWALTSADIIGWNVPRDDAGEIKQDIEFPLWSNINYYQVYSNEGLLLSHGDTIFTKA